MVLSFTYNGLTTWIPEACCCFAAFAMATPTAYVFWWYL